MSMSTFLALSSFLKQCLALLECTLQTKTDGNVNYFDNSGVREIKFTSTSLNSGGPIHSSLAEALEQMP